MRRHVYAQELQAPDVGHLVPAAGTANFGVTAVAAIHEPVADTASDTAPQLAGSGMVASPPADDAITADCERLGAFALRTLDDDSASDVERVAAAPPATVLSPDARLSGTDSTAGATPQHTATAADREPQRPMVRGRPKVGSLQMAESADTTTGIEHACSVHVHLE
jgi:hypothetical protein